MSNGDGFADLLIGATFSDIGGSDRGLAWVVFGGGTPPAAQGLAARCGGGHGLPLPGRGGGRPSGLFHRATPGMSMATASTISSSARVTPIPTRRRRSRRQLSGLRRCGEARELADAADGANDNLIALANLTPATGFRFDGGASFDYSGWSVSGAGDVNGDGFADLLIGAPYADPNSGATMDEGAAYIVFGGGESGGDSTTRTASADGRIDLAQDLGGQGPEARRRDGLTRRQQRPVGGAGGRREWRRLRRCAGRRALCRSQSATQ